MKIVIIDCATAGASGDKLLSAVVDAGGKDVRVEVERIVNSIVGTGNFHFEEAEVDGLKGLRAVDDFHGRRYEGDLVEAVRSACSQACLSPWGLSVSTRAANLILEAEREVHGGDRLHELGEVDTVVDIVGTIKALEGLGLSGAEFFTTPVRVGTGTVKSGHGVLPIPAPALLNIARRTNLPILLSPTNGEYTTPTGAALVAALTSGKSSPPPFRVRGGGVGVGTLRLEVPNVTRVIIGECNGKGESMDGCVNERLYVVECNVDDISGEVLGWLWERLREVAEDVSFTPIFMKKCRPGFTIKVVVRPELRDEVVKVIMKEVGTLGVKIFECERMKADREIREEKIRIGDAEYKVRVKISRKSSRMKLEFDDLKKIAVRECMSLREVMEEAIRQVSQRYQKAS